MGQISYLLLVANVREQCVTFGALCKGTVCGFGAMLKEQCAVLVLL